MKPSNAHSVLKKSVSAHKPIVRKPPLRHRLLRRQLPQHLPSLKHLNLLLKKPARMPRHLRRVALHRLKRLSALSASVRKSKRLRIVQRVAQRTIAGSRASLPLPARSRAMMVPVRVHSLR